MARIVYSCCGEGRGHSSRTLAITRALLRRGHQVLNFASGQALPYLQARLPDVRPIPGLRIVYRDNRVDVWRTVTGNLGLLGQRGRIVRALASQVREYRADYAIVDFEPWLPQAARRVGLPFLSLDHQHVLPHLRLRVPPRCWVEYWSALAVVRFTHSGEQANLVTSFYHPDPPYPGRMHFLPPILRDEVSALRATNAGHVVVYQTSSSFARLPEVLKQLPFEFRIYAFNRTGREGNLVFRPRNDEAFLADVASADWILTNGGYTLISEALHFGKPVFSVPVAGQFEQWVNAHFVERLGFGRHCATLAFGEEALRRFIAERETFRVNLRGRNFQGNDAALAAIHECLRAAGLTDGAAGGASL